MPQLDVSTYTSQLFWLILNFGALYLFTARITIPRIAKILETRWQRIEGSIKRADDLKHQAERVKGDFEKALEEARGQAHAYVMEAIHKVAISSHTRKNDITNMLLSKIQSAETHIERQKVQAMDEVKSIAERIAVNVVEKLTEQKVDLETVEKVMNQLIRQKVA